MTKPCGGTLYEINGKYFCVGEKLSKKVNGKTRTIYRRKSMKQSKQSKTRQNRT